MEYIQKSRCLLPKVKTLSGTINENSLRSLYYGLILPHFSYGIIGWAGVSSSHLKCLMVLQKYIIKVIYKKTKRFPSTSSTIQQNYIHYMRQIYLLYLLICNKLLHYHTSKVFAKYSALT
nr:unnamed protein product [Callosobruchus chinensis]